MLAIQQFKQVSASGQVVLGDGRILAGFTFKPGTTASTLTLYDNNAGSGTIIGELIAAANGPSLVVMPIRVPVSIGIFAALAGTGASVVVYYE